MQVELSILNCGAIGSPICDGALHWGVKTCHTMRCQGDRKVIHSFCLHWGGECHVRIFHATRANLSILLHPVEWTSHLSFGREGEHLVPVLFCSVPLEHASSRERNDVVAFAIEDGTEFCLLIVELRSTEAAFVSISWARCYHIGRFCREF